MENIKAIGKIFVLIIFLGACSQSNTPLPVETTTIVPVSPVQQQEAEKPTTAPQTTMVAPADTPDPPAFPLAEPGPYIVSRRSYMIEDASRGNRKVSISVWYPAVVPEGTLVSPLWVGKDLDPDLSGAPYPLLISSSEMATTLARYLVSHGFSWASVNGINSYAKMNQEMYSQPLDILFALDQAASGALAGMQGVIDAEHAGALGYSFDGYNTLAMSGARVNPDYYLENCQSPDALTIPLLTELSAFNCDPANNWDAFSADVGEDITTSEDGLWQPMTDNRIRAVMPMAGEGWWLFGERGLAAVDRPTLMIAATQDNLYPENALIFEHLGTPDKAFISFVGLDHMMIFQNKPIAKLAHFATAFFGYHLQGREDYGAYFSEEFVSQFDDLAWGVVSSD